MDEIDLKITRILFSNSRTSYREIGEQVGQSTTTVYKRVQEMVDSKIIQKFRTHLDIGALGALMVWIFGSTSISSEDVFIKNMSRNDRVKFAVYGAGNYAHVGLYIKDISELEENVNYVKNMGDFTSITVGTHQRPSEVSVEDLDATDFKIVHALKDNSRKTGAKIARELDRSAKTINKRIDRLVNKKYVECTIDWTPDREEMIVPYIQIWLHPSANKMKIAGQLFNEFDSNLVFPIMFHNLPDFVYGIFWVRTFRDLQSLSDRLKKIEQVKKIEMNIITRGKVFDTWIEKKSESFSDS